MRCSKCPVRPGLACLGETHRPVCRDVEAGMPGRAAQLAALAEGPGPLAMAAGLAGAVVAHVADGMREAPPEVRAGRRGRRASRAVIWTRRGTGARSAGAYLWI